MTILVRPAAAAELEEAFGWYEEHRPGLGNELLEEVHRAVMIVAGNPRRYPVVRRDTRRILLKGFPYSILYRAQDEDVIVVAIFHASRDPRMWETRD